MQRTHNQQEDKTGTLSFIFRVFPSQYIKDKHQNNINGTEEDTEIQPEIEEKIMSIWSGRKRRNPSDPITENTAIQDSLNGFAI